MATTETLEALDFMVNVLKEHEKDLDRLVNQLGAYVSKIEVAVEMKESELMEKLLKLKEENTAAIKDLKSLVSDLQSKVKKLEGKRRQ